MTNFNMVYSGSVVLQWQVRTVVGPVCMEFTLLASVYYLRDLWFLSLLKNNQVNAACVSKRDR